MARAAPLLAAAAVACLATPALCGDIDVIIARSRAEMWPSTPSALNATATTALQLAASLNSSCYWPDINYNNEDRADWLAANHFERVQTMVAALTAPGSPVFEAPGLSSATHCALGAWIFRSPRFSNPNWWYKWIGINLSLQSAFLMLGANRTTPDEQAALVSFSYDSAWWINDYGGGDNLSDMLRIQIWRSAASGNVSGVGQAFATLWANAVLGGPTTNYEGPQYDASYHFHGEALLSSAYGQGWASTMLDFFQVAAGTAWQPSDAQLGVLAFLLADGDAQLTFGAGWDFGTQGRGIDRPGTTFAWSLPTGPMRTLASTPAGAPYATRLLAFADVIDGVQPGPAEVLTGSKHFFDSDFSVHHRPTWGASLKMHGNHSLWTITPNECDNGENELGEYTGDGVLNIFPSAQLGVAEEAYAGIFPLWDWSALNGATLEDAADSPIATCSMATGDQWRWRQTAFVGAASDGASLAAAFDAASRNLTVRKAYLMFDDVVLALGANLTEAEAGVRVRTTLASRLLPNPASDPRGALIAGFANGSSASLADGNYSFAAGELAWLAAGGISMLPAVTPASPASPASPAAVGVSVGTVTAPWSRIGPFPGSSTGRLLTAFLDHGRGVQGGAFSYLLAPNTTAAAAPGIAAAGGGLACITNTPELQGAADPAAGVAAAVFWERGGGVLPCASQAASGSGGANLTIASDSDGIVLARVNATTASVTVAHPGIWAAGSTVRVTLQLAASGAACAPSAGGGSTGTGGAGGTVFSLRLPPAGDFMGSSVTASCTLSTAY